MIFLHSHGVSTSRAVRIFKIYGADAIQVLSENPYRLARDVRGFPGPRLLLGDDPGPRRHRLHADRGD